MSDEDTQYLMDCLKAGLFVWHRNPSDHWQQISRIVWEIPSEDESGPCAFFKDVGGYSALDACCKEDFMVTTGNITNWPVAPRQPDRRDSFRGQR